MPSPPLTSRVRPDLAELPQLVAVIESFAEQHELSPADTFSLTLAAEELFANTVRHSSSPATEVLLSLHADDDDTVTVTYSDNGSPFDPTQQAAPDTTLSAEERAAGGLGIQIIRKTMQSFTYERREGYNHITFSRRAMQ